MLRPTLVAALVLAARAAAADPAPGDLFHEYRYDAETIIEVDPDTQQPNLKFAKRRQVSFRVRSLDIWDLEDATRAEIAFEIWGGHAGTSGQTVRVNGGAWTPIPEVEGTPGEPRCYHRTRLGSAVVPLPIGAIKLGRNTFEFRAGKQICHSINWPIYKIYGFTVRVYYDPARKPRPDGRIVGPRDGGTIGDGPALAAEVRGAPGNPDKLEFTPSSVTRVEYVGLYDDFNWEGDGRFRRWHFQLERGALARHIGTATAPPYRVTWDNRWIPDQTQPIELAARIVDSHGLVYMTSSLRVTLSRPDRSVRLYRASGVPEAFGVRIGQRKSCEVVIAEDPRRARAARLVVSTWAGAHADAIGFNGRKVFDRIGRPDDYGYDVREIDPAVFRRGNNEFFIFSGTEEHQAEVNWPGPAVILEFPPMSRNRVARE
jgi:hypothetical protein